MTFEEIKAIARERGIRIAGVKKVEIVRAIQAQEGNEPCFGTGRAAECGQPRCLWVKACD
ncbi:MAG TPA: SAP domain-containing protein [Desulfuromonadaceae bacterium]